jgi:uncharacterized HhH-GPD family protein
MRPALLLTGDPEADQLLSESTFALLVGMALDQQIPMEVAFAGPKKIADRLGGLDLGFFPNQTQYKLRNRICSYS